MDIIILLILALWILFRLFSIIGQDLGGNTDAFKNDLAGIKKAKPASSVVDSPVKQKSPIDVTKNPTKSVKPISDAMREKIAVADPNFNPKEFIAGANTCFTMVIESFASGDKDALRGLLLPDIYTVFCDVIDERNANGERNIEEVISFIKTKISKATVKNGVIDISVDFATDQTNVSYNSEDRVIDGHPNDIIRADDTWVFSCDMNSKSKNWYLKETE